MDEQKKPKIAAYKLYATNMVSVGNVPTGPRFFAPLGASSAEMAAGIENMLKADPLSVFIPEGTKCFTGEERERLISYVIKKIRKS